MRNDPKPAILQALKDAPATCDYVARAVGASRHSTIKTFSALEAEGKIVVIKKIGNGIYWGLPGVEYQDFNRAVESRPPPPKTKPHHDDLHSAFFGLRPVI